MSPQPIKDEPNSSQLRLRPEERVRLLADGLGTKAVAAWCADLLSGQATCDDPDLPSLAWLGGPHGAVLLELGDLAARDQDYWPRVWAARALLHIWDPQACPAVVSALDDDAWRVREMAARVVRRWEVPDAADGLVALTADGVPRVRLAAVRALGQVGDAEHAEPVRAAAQDPDTRVAVAAARALDEMEQRLDRTFSD
jgi:HEAT repeat protein